MTSLQSGQTSIKMQGLHISIDDEEIQSPLIQTYLKQVLDLINTLHYKSGLKVLVVEIHPDMPSPLLTQFKSNLNKIKWSHLKTPLSSPPFNFSVPPIFSAIFFIS